MSSFREGERVDATRPDSGIRRGEQIDANRAAEQRIFECEHADDRVAEAEFVSRSAEILQEWEEKPADRVEMMKEIGAGVRKAHHVDRMPTLTPVPGLLEDKSEHGETTSNGQAIRVEASYFQEPDPQDALETTLHENRHVEQIEEKKKFEDGRLDEVNAERAKVIKWGLDHYASRNPDEAEKAKKIVDDDDAEPFAIEMSARILEKKAELEGRAGEFGGPAGGEVTSPADDAARQRLASEGEGA